MTSRSRGGGWSSSWQHSPASRSLARPRAGGEALELVELLRPDVLLLDIEMPAVDGFAVLKALPQGRAPAIIFVTAFQDHAVKAFELRATDFVVKPVRGDRLASALDQARSDLEARRAGERLAFLQARLAELESRALAASDPGLWVQIGSEKRRLALGRHPWLQAERDYVRVHMTGHTHLVNAMLGDMEKALDERAVPPRPPLGYRSQGQGPSGAARPLLDAGAGTRRRPSAAGRPQIQGRGTDRFRIRRVIVRLQCPLSTHSRTLA